MERFAEIVSKVDDFVWGPVMLVLLVGTGIFLTFRTRFLTWRNLGYALKSTLSKEARTKSRGEGDVSPFSALTTALAATIGTGNIVGVATAMVSGGPGALVWMWISAAFGLTSKFSECMLAIKYREVNEKGEMSGGPMYTMKKGLKNKKLGAVLAWFFALFAVIASFGIGNMTQGNSISGAIKATFHVPTGVTGIVITVLSLLIIVGGIKSISKVSSVVVPVMAIFYVICGVIVIIGNIANLPAGVAMIFKMAFSVKAVGGGRDGSALFEHGCPHPHTSPGQRVAAGPRAEPAQHLAAQEPGPLGAHLLHDPEDRPGTAAAVSLQSGREGGQQKFPHPLRPSGPGRSPQPRPQRPLERAGQNAG